MKALLLNSGIGKRMGKLTEEKPKCMCEIGNGYTIISWQLKLLQKYGIDEYVITTGPHSTLLMEYILMYTEKSKVSFVNNPIYAESNYIYSMYLAKQKLDDDILLLHGDLVMEPSVIEDLLASEQSAVTVDRSLSLPEKDFKAKTRDGKVKAVGIEFFGDDCVACQPAYKLNRSDFTVWMEEIEKFCFVGNIKVYAENALNAVCSRINLIPLELGNRLCSEIDNIDDLETVSKRFQKLFQEGSPV